MDNDEGSYCVITSAARSTSKPTKTISCSARAVLKNCQGKTDSLSRWLQALIERHGFNKAAVALANKNARILWAMATQKKGYETAVA